MIAIILNSGIGKRMGRITTGIPKCMVELPKKETILGRQLKMLSSNSINRTIITTGPHKDKLIQYASSISSKEIEFIHSPLFETTNYIYSMFLVSRALDISEECLLLHGDLVFDNTILEKVINHNGSGVLVNFEADLPEKDFKARVVDGLVREIGIHLFNKDCHFCLPLYKLSPSLMKSWFNEIEKFVERGETGVYAENALNRILENNCLDAIPFSGELCAEIDNLEDLEQVRRRITEIER
jgi:choline kinase